MTTLFPLLFAGAVGFTHAFEADHLLAVSNMVSRRNSIVSAVKDGIFWGLGHTSTIVLIGILIMLAQVAVSEQTFQYFEAGVGLMLMVLGIQRLMDHYKRENIHQHQHQHDTPHDHRMAYSVGLIHGLAGSGTLVLLVMTELKSAWQGISYLLIFGAGSVVGMLLASGMFFLPFSQKLSRNVLFQKYFVWLSSALCIVFGAKVMLQNLMHT